MYRIRMFSRSNKLDYQLFFNTKGAFRRLGWNGLIVIAFLSNILNYQLAQPWKFPLASRQLLLVVPPIFGIFQSLGAIKVLPKSLRHAISIFSPLLAILLMVPSIAVFTTKNTTIKWIMFVLLFLPVLLITIRRLGFPVIIRLVDIALGAKKIFRRGLILNLCMLSALVMLVLMPDHPINCAYVLFYELYALVVVSFGNLQIPAAITRVVLALVRLVPHNYYGEDPDNPSKANVAPSLNIFYVMVLGQGIIYVVACILEIFSFIPKRSFVRHGELRSQWGVELVNLYYAYAFEKSMEGDVLGPKKISLNSFAIYCLNSDTPKMQLHGIRIMHSLLLREETRKQLFTKLTNSTKTMARLIEMLDWSSPEDTIIRLFAAKVTAELATSFRVTTIPGTIQVVSALLEYGNQQRGNPLLDVDVEYEKIHDPVLNIEGNQEERPDAVQDTGNLLETQEHSTQQGGTTEQHKSWILRCWLGIFRFRSIPQDGPLTERDLLPALGMSILDGLVGCDQENCVEISRASGLIPNIIRFTSYVGRTDTMYTNIQRKVLMTSSLKLLQSLTSIHGDIGITLRHKISKNPFLLRNLADVLGDSMNSQELRKLVTGILRNLAIDRDARQAIGRVQVILSRLMHAFLTPVGASSTESDHRLLRKVAGQALAVLAMDSAKNCLAMLREPKYEFIKELTSMIHVDKYRCMAASLLQSMCLHARVELKEPDMKELSYSLREVLERVMRSEGAELEILIGLSSQICRVIPGDFARELDHGQIKERFVKRLVDALNANWEPSADCPGIRRVILEQAINLMEYDSRYANFFNHRRMMEALSMVEETASDVENYRLFLGDAGLMEASEPLPRLVARAKQLLAVH
ncbi:hypothetical protein EJB05_10796, partial [Eragrostis curvula]